MHALRKIVILPILCEFLNNNWVHFSLRYYILYFVIPFDFGLDLFVYDYDIWANIIKGTLLNK